MKRLLPLLLVLMLTAPAWAAADAAEQVLAAKLQKQMDALLGPGKAQITVSGRSDDAYQSRRLTQKEVGTAAARRSNETQSNGKQLSESTHEQHSTVYNTTEELRIHSPIALSQKSVSVIYEPPAASETEAARPAVDQAMIEDLIRSAAGIDESKGDHLSVHAARLDTSKYDSLKAEMEKQKQGTPWWIFALISLLGIGLGTGFGLLLRRRQRPQVATEWQTASYVPAPTLSLQPGQLTQGVPVQPEQT